MKSSYVENEKKDGTTEWELETTLPNLNNTIRC